MCWWIWSVFCFLHKWRAWKRKRKTSWNHSKEVHIAFFLFKQIIHITLLRSLCSLTNKQNQLSNNNIIIDKSLCFWLLRIQKNGDNAVQDPPVILTDLLPAFTPLRNFSLSCSFSLLNKFHYYCSSMVLTVFQYVMKDNSIILRFFIILYLTFFITSLPHFFINVFIWYNLPSLKLLKSYCNPLLIVFRFFFWLFRIEWLQIQKKFHYWFCFLFIHLKTNDFFSLTRPFDPEQENDTILTKLVWLKKQKEHSTYHPFIQWIFNKLKERNEHLREVIQQLTEPKGTHTKVTSITTTSMVFVSSIRFFVFTLLML